MIRICSLIFVVDIMASFQGELARSQSMGAPVLSNENGITTYDLSKKWIGEEYDVQVKNHKGEMETETKFRYHLVGHNLAPVLQHC